MVDDRSTCSSFADGDVARLSYHLRGDWDCDAAVDDLHFLTAVFATGAFYALWTRRYKLARVCAATQVTLILLGWAPRITLQLLLAALAAGAILLFPSYYYLFRMFKREPTPPETTH